MISSKAGNQSLLNWLTSMADVEEEVFGKLHGLTLEELVMVNAELKLPDIEEGKKVNKSHVLKVILKYLSSDTVEQSDDAGLSSFLWIKGFMVKKDKPVKDTKRETLEDNEKKKILKIQRF